MDFTPKTAIPRPTLPTYRNPHLPGVQAEGPQQVKFQIITRDAQEIIVGRIKIPTPGGHAFVLRRFDTGAVSLSTMFRSAFANITDEDEKIETSWVRANYDTAGANGGGRMRLAGTWIPVALAVHLAPSYSLGAIIQPLVAAVPGPKSDYRKSRGGQSPAPRKNNDNQNAPALPPTQASPAPSRSNTARELGAQTPLAKRAKKSQSPSPSVAKHATRSTPGRLKATSIPEEDEAANATTIDTEQDIAEAKAEVAALKAKAKAKHAKQVEVVVPATPSRKKRTIQDTEDTPPTLNMERIKEVEESVKNGTVEERPIIPLPPNRAKRLNPSNKAAAWGTLAFFAGVAAMTYVPQALQTLL